MCTIEHNNLIKLLKINIKNNSIENIKFFIEKKIINIDIDNGIMLRCSSLYNRLDIVKLLISERANIFIAEGKALKLATEKGNTDIVKYLIEKGALISNFYNKFVKYIPYEKYKSNLLIVSAKNGHLSILKCFIEYFKYSGGTFDISEALDNASINGHKEIVEYLIDIDASTKICDRILINILKNKHIEIIKILIKNRTLNDYNTPKDTTIELNNDFNEALKYACENGLLDVITCLFKYVSHDICLDYKNLLISVAKNEHEEVFIYLLDNYEDDKLTINLETNSTEYENILKYFNSYLFEEKYESISLSITKEIGKNTTIEIKKNRKRNRDISNIEPFISPFIFEYKKKRIE